MERTYPLRLLLRDLKASEEFSRLAAEIGRFDASGDGFPGPLGLVVYELGEPRKDLARIRQAVEAGSAGEFMVVSQVRDPEVVIGAMRAGAKEFVSWPAPAHELREALLRFVERMDKAQAPETPRSEARPGHVVHVIGAKGGMGSTTLAVNLGLEYTRLRKDNTLALVDMHLPFGEMPMFLDMRCEYSWSEITRDISRLDDSFISGLMTRHKSGMDVLSAPDKVEDIEISGPEAATAMFETLRRMYDLIIVDGSPYLDETSVRAIQAADEVLLVVQLSLPCLANAKKLLDSFQEADPATAAKFRVVVNRYLSKSEITVAEAEEILGRKVFARIGNDYPGTLNAINQGRSIREVSPKSPALKGIQDLALRLAGTSEAHEPARGQGLLSRLFARKEKTASRREVRDLPGGAAAHGEA